MAINKQQLVKDYEEAFGRNAALPIAFWHSDTPIAEPEKTGGCFIPVLEDARCGYPVSLDAETMLCGGGIFLSLPCRLRFPSLGGRF